MDCKYGVLCFCTDGLERYHRLQGFVTLEDASNFYETAKATKYLHEFATCEDRWTEEVFRLPDGVLATKLSLIQIIEEVKGEGCSLDVQYLP